MTYYLKAAINYEELGVAAATAAMSYYFWVAWDIYYEQMWATISSSYDLLAVSNC